MKKLALFLLPYLAFAQTAKFPTSVVTDNQLTVATNRLTAQVAAPVTSSQTTITVASIAGGPVPAYTLFTIDQGAAIETVMVCSASGTTLTIGYSSCPNVDGRGFDNTTAQAHSTGAVVNAYFVAWQQNAPNKEIEAIEGALGAGFSYSRLAQKFTGAGPPGSIALSLPGDIYADTTNDFLYQCFQTTVTACTAVASSNWVKISSSGSVVSVGLTAPGWLTVGGSPVTISGTLAITAATGQTSHQVIGTCNAATSFAPCALVAGDLPGATVFNNIANAFTGGFLQNFSADTMRFPESAIASFPSASANTNLVFVGTDATGPSDCTVGLSTGFRSLCISNGTAWVALGGGGGSSYSNLTQDGTTGDLLFAAAIVGPAPAAPAFSASLTVNLSNCAGGVCTMATMAGNVTATLSNPKAGQHLDFVWTQPSTGGTYNYTVAYNSPVVSGSTCQLTVGQGVTTTQHFVVLPGGAIQGQGCVDSTLYSPPAAGTYGDSAHVGQFTLDTKGRITAASNVAVTGGGGNSFADYTSGSVTVANTGSDVTIYSAAMPALPAGACYSLKFDLQFGGSVAATIKLFVGSTQIGTPFAGTGAITDIAYDIDYCNQAGVQNAQNLLYFSGRYGTGGTGPVTFYAGGTNGSPSNTDATFSTPTGIDWSSGNTIYLKTNAASANTVGAYLQVHAH
jgi:hypothetical protein